MDHSVQLYQDFSVLADAVAQYIATGLEHGEAAIIIATPAHRAAIQSKIPNAKQARADGRLSVLDAERTLERFTANGMPQWKQFRAVIGGLIADLRLRYPTVRAYGEMVDVLWQRGAREAAIRLEEHWNELGRQQTFSLLCAYRMDPLDSQQYGGPLESVCKVHSRLLPGRDVAGFDAAVKEASGKVLDQPFAQLLLALAEKHRMSTRMPAGQAALFWLNQNMPRTAEKILSELRTAASRAA